MSSGTRARVNARESEKSGPEETCILHAATALEDLRIPPGNRLEALVGDRRGQHSIRINDRSRVCFVWRDGDAYEIEITDYH
jgi:toxin HigB-1